jgi:nitrogen fixation protein
MPTNKLSAEKARVLFVRVGWMRSYAGPIPGDERPVGGGSHNKTGLGHEVYNFKVARSRLYGYFQPSAFSNTVALERIDVAAVGASSLKGVLVIFVARRAKGGQFIVGWYKDALVFREHVRHSPGKPRKFGHYCSAEQRNCVLLADADRKHEIFSEKGGMGQANVCYPLKPDGSRKTGSWIQQALDYISAYKGNNILSKPETAAEEDVADAAERALARSQGQGFARTAEERRVLEGHSMAAAKRYFRSRNFRVEDVSATRSYDLLCKRGKKELHVEVKGTTTSGGAVVLTNGEVKHAQDIHNACVLFILHSIKLKRKRASGGKSVIMNPWRLKQAHLTPISFIYRLP